VNEYARYQFYFNIFQFVFMCVIAIVGWWRTRETADTAKLAAVADAMDAKLKEARAARDTQCQTHKQETSRVTQECHLIQVSLARLPSDDKIIAIHKRLDVLVQNFSNFQGEIKGELKGMSHTLDLLQEHHINGGQ